MILNDKHLFVFAATGAIGSEAARVFAREGAHVHLSGLRQDALDALQAEIVSMGGSASVQVVDATDAAAVDRYVAATADQVGRVDGMFNAIGARPVDLGYPTLVADLTVTDFMKPFNLIVASSFITARAVGERLAQQGGGSIVLLTATLSVMTTPLMSGIVSASTAVEGLTRALAGDYGPANVRVNCVRGNGMPETRTIQETGAGYIALGKMPSMVPPPLGRPISTTETAQTAAFLLSDLASGMTAQVVTVSAGAFIGH